MMGLLSLHVEGFKSLRNAQWRPGALNVVIGPNASGKTNLLDLLDLLSKSSSGGLKHFIQESGGTSAVFWDGRVEEIAIDIGVHVGEGEWRSNPDYRYRLTIEGDLLWGGYGISLEQLDFLDEAARLPPETLLARSFDKLSVLVDRQGNPHESTRRVPGEESVVSSFGFFEDAPSWLLRSELERWTVYRGFDTRRDAPVRQPTLTRHETRVEANGSNLVPVLHTLYTEDRQFRRELNEAMHAAFGQEFEELTFPPAADQMVQMRVGWRSLKRPQSAFGLSDGTLRFLYLIAILANPEPPRLVAIEEPEVGLHPAMLPIIAEYAVQASKKTQVIFTTHSPDLLDAFRHTGVSPTTTVARSSKGGTELSVLDGEELEYWLREYTLGQLFRSNELEQIG